VRRLMTIFNQRTADEIEDQYSGFHLSIREASLQDCWLFKISFRTSNR
jgi:hypothetical protein